MGWGKVDTGIVCSRCGNTFYPDGEVKYIKDWDGEHCYSCYFLVKFRDRLYSLIDSKVTGVIEVKETNTFILVFDNGLQLTAEDGEYGDNAFDFVEEGDA